MIRNDESTKLLEFTKRNKNKLKKLLDSDFFFNLLKRRKMKYVLCPINFDLTKA